FRTAVIRLWTRPALLKSVPLANGKEGETGQVRASLSSLIQEAYLPYAIGKQLLSERECWRQIRTADAEWLWPVVDDGGMIVPSLAMRYDLFDHIGVRFDATPNQTALRRLGTRYGVFSDKAGVTDRMSGGGRLAILAPEITREILSQPTNEPEEPLLSDSGTPSDSDSGVTEKNLEEQ